MRLKITLISLFVFIFKIHANAQFEYKIINDTREKSVLHNAYKGNIAFQNSLYKISDLQYKFYKLKMDLGGSPIEAYYYSEGKEHGSFCFWNVSRIEGDDVDITNTYNIFFTYKEIDKICSLFKLNKEIIISHIFNRNDIIRVQFGINLRGNRIGETDIDAITQIDLINKKFSDTYFYQQTMHNILKDKRYEQLPESQFKRFSEVISFLIN